jgi:hypothetical protein
VIRSRRQGPVLLGILLSFSVILSGCSTQGLNFREDERVRITFPKPQDAVRFPFTMRWSVKNFEITGLDGSAREDSGYFGFFIDRAPQPPSKTFAWLARNDLQCKNRPGCPDNAYFKNLGVHSLTKTSFTIENIIDPDPLNISRDRREFHEVIIILLNGRGERIGESAFRVEFEAKREQT